MTKKILFGIDLEEFDIPEEYGQNLPLDIQLKVTLQGLEVLEDLLNKYQVRVTFFTTAFWATHFPERILLLAKKHEIASHGYYHTSFKREDLLISRDVLTRVSGQQIQGFRMPRMQEVDLADLKQAGYTYDSSSHPTYIPGRYSHLKKPKQIFIQDGIVELPVSVSPVFRIPVFWLAFKNFPYKYYIYLCKKILNHHGYLILYIHPWEFADLSSFKLPFIVKRRYGASLRERTDRLFAYLSELGRFITHKEMVNDFLTQTKLNKDPDNPNPNTEQILLLH